MLRKLFTILTALFFIALVGITRAATAPAAAGPLIADQNGHTNALLLAVGEEKAEGVTEEDEDEDEEDEDEDEEDEDEDEE